MVTKARARPRRFDNASALAAIAIGFFAGTLPAQDIQPRMSTGRAHGVLLGRDGIVRAWGNNGQGQVGGSEDYVARPTPVPGLTGFRDIAAGRYFSLGLRGDGTVWGWGDDRDGALGESHTKDRAKPEPIAGLTGVVAIAAADDAALALKSDGSVWAWGELEVTRRTPARIEGIADVKAVAACSKNAVALKSDGTVWIWGYHGAGDQGNGNYGYASAPIQIQGLSDAKAVAAADQLTVALKNDGTVWTIGYGSSGQLGNGSTENSTKPVMVARLANVKAIAAGSWHVLALKNDGSVWAWGNNHEGQLGHPGIRGDGSAEPVQSGALTGVVAIAAGANHSLALTGDGVVWGWGDNSGGALAPEEDLQNADVPMRIGQPLPGKCNPLFACGTANARVIEICGEQDESDIQKWTGIQYRFGPEHGAPELVFPNDPDRGPSRLFFSHQDVSGDYRVSVRFSSGAYSYRVFSGSSSGAGVEVRDSKGKILSTVQCAERPYMFAEYLRQALPCDMQNPHGAAACKEKPYRTK